MCLVGLVNESVVLDFGFRFARFWDGMDFCYFPCSAEVGLLDACLEDIIDLCYCFFREIFKIFRCYFVRAGCFIIW